MTERSSAKPESDAKPESKSVIDQVVELATKALFPLSGGATVYFLFLDKDLTKALMTFALTAGSGLVGGFFKPINKWLNQKFEQAGEVTKRGLDRNVDRTVGRFTDWETAYLDALKTHCEALEVEGFKGDLASLPLEEIFVPLCLDTDPGRRLNLSANIRCDIWQLLPKADRASQSTLRIAIIADPGCGKTTLTRHLAQSYANRSHRQHQAKDLLPVLLRLRDIYTSVQSATAPNLPSLIVQRIAEIPRCRELSLSTQWFEDRLKGGQCLVMLDGLDEVPESQREKVSRWANWQMQNYETPFILTSRPHGYNEDLFGGVQRIGILDFTNDDKVKFINNWYRFITYEQKWKPLLSNSQQRSPSEQLSPKQVKAESDAEAQQAAYDLCKQLFKHLEISELAKNPLLITIIAATHRAFEQLPNRRVKLYQKMFNLLLEDRPNRRETRLKIADAEKNQAILQALALQLVQQVKTQFTPKQGSDWIGSELKQQCNDTAFTPKQFLREIQTITGLLTGGEGELYQFSHKTFQEYLAAIELQQRRKEKFLLEKFGESDWENVLCFYTLLAGATPFVEQALENPQGWDGLKLAHRMVEEGSQIEAELRDRLNQVLEAQQINTELTATARLTQRFQQLAAIPVQPSIDPDPITWGEYELFLKAQISGEFHSNAEIVQVANDCLAHPITGICLEDARWFCAWLSTQTSLLSYTRIYDYRLPTSDEKQSLADRQIQGTLYVVREPLPDRYYPLFNYLATGRWYEADQETAKVMVEVARRVKQGTLDVEFIRQFPCKDFQWLDCLWVKFSGGHFGFSVQKEIYVEMSNPPNGRTYDRFCDRVGWKVKKEWQFSSLMDFPFSCPKGLLPWIMPIVIRDFVFGEAGVMIHGSRGEREIWYDIFSRIKACKL
jgi:GUN4-like/NACHT domain/Sulfatase-modifying factor enzyme 1